MEFTKKEVAAKFDNLAETDISIHLSSWSGKLKNIPLSVAEDLAKKESQYIKAKPSPRVTRPETTGESK